MQLHQSIQKLSKTSSKIRSLTKISLLEHNTIVNIKTYEILIKNLRENIKIAKTELAITEFKSDITRGGENFNDLEIKTIGSFLEISAFEDTELYVTNECEGAHQRYEKCIYPDSLNVIMREIEIWNDHSKKLIKAIKLLRNPKIIEDMTEEEIHTYKFITEMWYEANLK